MKVTFTIREDDGNATLNGWLEEVGGVLAIHLPDYGSNDGGDMIFGLALQDGEVKAIVWARDGEEPSHTVVLEKQPDDFEDELDEDGHSGCGQGPNGSPCELCRKRAAAATEGRCYDCENGITCEEHKRVCTGCGTTSRDWWRPDPDSPGKWLCGWCFVGEEDAEEPKHCLSGPSEMRLCVSKDDCQCRCAGCIGAKR